MLFVYELSREFLWFHLTIDQSIRSREIAAEEIDVSQPKNRGGEKFPHQNARGRIQDLCPPCHSLPWEQHINGYGSIFQLLCIKLTFPSFPPLQSGLKRLENSCIAAIRRGPVPQHIAIIMDGNRRYARSRRIDTAEGHYSGAESLKNVSYFCCSSNR